MLRNDDRTACYDSRPPDNEDGCVTGRVNVCGTGSGSVIDYRGLSENEVKACGGLGVAVRGSVCGYSGLTKGEIKTGGGASDGKDTDRSKYGECEEEVFH